MPVRQHAADACPAVRTMPNCAEGREPENFVLAEGQGFLLSAMRHSKMDFVAGLEVSDVGGKP